MKASTKFMYRMNDTNVLSEVKLVINVLFYYAYLISELAIFQKERKNRINRAKILIELKISHSS